MTRMMTYFSVAGLDRVIEAEICIGEMGFDKTEVIDHGAAPPISESSCPPADEGQPLTMLRAILN